MKIKNTYLYQILLVFFLIRQLFWGRILWTDSIQSNFLRIANFSLIAIFVLGFFIYFLEMYVSKDYFYYCIVIPIIMVILFLSAIKISNFDILLTILLVLLAKDVDYYKIVKTYFITMCIICAFVIVSSYVGITVDWIVNFTYGTGHSMGFNHPNNLGVIILSIVASWLYLYPNVKFPLLFGVPTIAGLIIWKIAAARTSAILLLAIPWLIFLFKSTKKFNFQNILKWEFWIVILAFLLSIYLMYRIGLRGSMNNFESRFNMPYILYNQYGINLFGSKLPLVGSREALQYKVQSIILDNAYLRVLLINGILTTLIIIDLYAVLINNAYKSKKYILLIIIVLFIVEGFMEQFFLYAEFNFTILATFANLNSLGLKDRKV